MRGKATCICALHSSGDSALPASHDLGLGFGGQITRLKGKRELEQRARIFPFTSKVLKMENVKTGWIIF